MLTIKQWGQGELGSGRRGYVNPSSARGLELGEWPCPEGSCVWSCCPRGGGVLTSRGLSDPAGRGFLWRLTL